MKLQIKADSSTIAGT